MFLSIISGSMRPSFACILVIASCASLCLAQTSTSCNPTERTDCPVDTGLSSATFSSLFTSGSSNSSWNATYGTINYGSSGAEFTINKQGDAPTVETEFYFFFGQIEVVMQAANGTGIVSSIVLESDDLDEIDWEILGGNTTSCETNYFGKGNTTTYDRAIYYPVSTPQTTFHTYTVNWTPSSITWAIDNSTVRTLEYASANDGSNFPQTPMRLKMGIWAGGDPTNPEGTITWAGGETDYSDAPFTMYVESVKITNYNPASEYKYNGTSGAYTSIESINGTNTGVNGTQTTGNSSSTASGSSSGSSGSVTATSSSAAGSSTQASSDGAFLRISRSAVGSAFGLLVVYSLFFVL